MGDGPEQRGAPADASELFPLVYEELRSLAGRYFVRQPAQTIQPTSLVHEAFLRLADPGSSGGRFRDREHFCAVAATAMRQILVDRARRRSAQKRGGEARPVTLVSGLASAPGPDLDVIDLDRALTELAAVDPRRARVVELRYFGGLTTEEIARQLGRSTRTVELDWRGARAWLIARLERAENR
jgi:RNA polymerase sigma factor (TIGR02999 family)